MKTITDLGEKKNEILYTGMRAARSAALWGLILTCYTTLQFLHTLILTLSSILFS